VRLISSGKQDGAAVLGEGHDNATGETCIPAFANVNNLGEAAVLFLFCGRGCAHLSLQINILGKTVELHFSLLMSSSHNPLSTISFLLLIVVLVCSCFSKS
jgi:hypothetical protein